MAAHSSILAWRSPWTEEPGGLQSTVSPGPKNLPTTQKTQVPSLVGDNPLDKEMTTHSSILAWRSPRTEGPDGLQSIGLQRVGHD